MPVAAIASGVSVSISSARSTPRNQSCVGMSKPVFLRFSTVSGSLPRISSRSTNFCCDPADLQPLRQRCRELHNPVIQERRTHFQRMRHAHPVRLVQNIVRQVVVLIHRQIPVQHALRRRSPVRPPASADPLPFVPGRICSSCSGENVPFQKKCASSGSSRLPSSHRFSLYSRLILSSDTGKYRSSAPRISRRSRAGTSAERPRQPVRLIRQVSAEQLVRAFAGERHRHVPPAHPREEPHRQRPRVRARFVGIIREILNRALQFHVRVQIEFVMVRPVDLAPSPGNTGSRRNSVPANETENVFSCPAVCAAA